MIRRPPRSTQSRSSAASDVYKRQVRGVAGRHRRTGQGHVLPHQLRSYDVSQFGGGCGRGRIVAAFRHAASRPVRRSACCLEARHWRASLSFGVGGRAHRRARSPCLKNNLNKRYVKVDFLVPGGIVRESAGSRPCATKGCLLYTSPSPRDRQKSRMPSSA